MNEYEDSCPKCDEGEALLFTGDLDGMTFLRAECGCEFTDAERGNLEDAVLERAREAWLYAQAESDVED